MNFSSEEEAIEILDRSNAAREQGIWRSDSENDDELQAFLFLRGGGRKGNFYQTKAWRQLRYKVLKMRGRACECCGGTPSDGTSVHVDHIKPRSKYPDLELDPSNLQVLCADCNIGKGNSDSIDWREG